jgi:hypothetical protein
VSSAIVQGFPDGLIQVSVRKQGVGSVIDVEARWINKTINGSIVITTGRAECPQITIPIAYIKEAGG